MSCYIAKDIFFEVSLLYYLFHFLDWCSWPNSRIFHETRQGNPQLPQVADRPFYAWSEWKPIYTTDNGAVCVPTTLGTEAAHVSPVFNATLKTFFTCTIIISSDDGRKCIPVVK